MSRRHISIPQIIRSIREFHELGRQSLRKRGGKGDHGSGAIATEATELGVNEDYLRKARIFASPDRGYSREELKALLQAVRDSKDTFAERGTSFGVSHLLRLVTVSKADRQRSRLQSKMFTQGWSVAELNAAIIAQYGRRRQGGRRIRVGDESSVLRQIESMCEHWRRWHLQMTEQDEARDTKRIEKLPGSVRNLVVNVTRAMALLQEAVFKAATENE